MPGEYEHSSSENGSQAQNGNLLENYSNDFDYCQ